MSVPPSAGAASDQPVDNAHAPSSPLRTERPDGESSSRTLGGNAVGVLTALAFVAFLFTYAVFGQRAAGIAFWSVLLGLPVLLLVLSALGTAWRASRREELLEVATLAVRLVEQRRSEHSGAKPSMKADPARSPVDDPRFWDA